MLGSGGIKPSPIPNCECRVCKTAIKEGIPNYRTGSALYNYDAKLLFDLSEDIRYQLIRERITDINNILITHWHPDHTQGIRILEQLNYDFVNNKPLKEPINVYISKNQYLTFKKYSCGKFLDFYEKDREIIKIKFFKHNEPIKLINDIIITPFYIKKTKGFYFLIEQNKKKLVYAPCEYFNLEVYQNLKNIDIFIVHHLYYKNKNISKIDWSTSEDSFEKMLLDAKKMNAKKIIITHIEELFGYTHDELNQIVKKYYPPYNIEFGYDGMIIQL